ncbi:MAG: DUF4388 domain-containing protein [Acidimicrobiia bacterium]
MALQGTLDTFALPDVLHLLATTKKTGCLRLDGRRGAGTVHVDAGEIVAVTAAHVPGATEAADALFELLRFEEGSFAFDPDVAPDERQPATDVATLLDAATALLAEWREIEAVVPSLDAQVSLRPALAGDQVTIPAEQWSHLVAVGGGRTVRSLGQHLDLSELPVSRVVRDLVELGVVELEDRAPEPVEDPRSPDLEAPRVSSPLGTDVGAAPEPGSTDEASRPADGDGPSRPVADADASTGEAPTPESGAPLLDEGLPVARPIKARRPRPRLLESSGEPERFVPLDLPGHQSAGSGSGGDPDIEDLTAAFPGLASRGTLTAEEEGAVSEQLGSLSPEAADAVLAAAEEPEEEAMAAALDAAVDGEDAPINRGLLLKFLGSAKS